jgi:hypothetical protein
VLTWPDSNVLAETPHNPQKYDVMVNTSWSKRYSVDELESPCSHARSGGAGIGLALGVHNDEGDSDDEMEILFPCVLLFKEL